MIEATTYTLDELKEARYLVDRSVIDRHQALCILCEFIPQRDWICVECELDKHDYTLKDRICNLLSQEE